MRPVKRPVGRASVGRARARASSPKVAVVPAQLLSRALAAVAPVPRWSEAEIGSEATLPPAYPVVSHQDSFSATRPARPGLRDAAVGTEDCVNERTLTRRAAVEPCGDASPAIGAASPQRQAPTMERMSSSPPRIPCSPGPSASPYGRGRQDLFGQDVDAAEAERERRKVQAQMLAEQIAEQHQRKEEEKRRLAEEELLDEQRLERERREIQERMAPASVTKASNNVAAAASPVESSSRRVKAADSDWTPSPAEAGAGGRRRRRALSSGTWRATDRSQGDSAAGKVPRDSPTPWPSSNADAEGLSTVREQGDVLERTAARRTRQSREDAERCEASPLTDGPWRPEPGPRGSRHLGRRARHGAERPPAGASEAAESLSKEDLQEQLGSLLRVCEQLLRERVEDRLERREKDRDVDRGDAVGSNAGAAAGPARRSPTGQPRRSAGRRSGGRSQAPIAPVERPIYESHCGLVQAAVDDAWPPDALAGILSDAAGQGNGLTPSLQPCRPAPAALDLGQAPNPFVASNARGMAVRWQGCGGRQRSLMSPSNAGLGGLNVQAHWPAVSRASPVADGLLGTRGNDDGLGCREPPHGARPSGPSGPRSGPGHVPTGIGPSIQAHSAMLRELYPHGPPVAGLAGPLHSP